MLILGIDPGFAIVGFGLVEADRGRQRLVQCGAITTPAGGAPARTSAADRRRYGPVAGPIPAPGHGSGGAVFQQQYYYGHRRGPGQGSSPAGGGAPGVPIFEYTPSQVKQAVVGYGKAEKRQVMDMTRRLLNLSAVPKPDDAADAVAIALCHARSFTSRLQSPDAARPGSGRYEVRKQVR